jgi:hypothetical protein
MELVSEWLNIYHECLIDADYSIINIIESPELSGKIYYLNLVKLFMYNLQHSYKNLNALMRQVKVDYPRIRCYVNNIKIPTYKEFKKRI